METSQKQVLQLKISLNDIQPQIWRRIQVPDSYTFWELHIAIQDAMGWSDSHLHEFLVTDPQARAPVGIGVPDEKNGGDRQVLPGREVPLGRYLRPEKPWATYTYDFGDDWVHALLLESLLPKDERQKYPRCLAGERACPPEDCGGPPGYEEFLRAIGDPEHEEHEAMVQWAGGSFNPEAFDAGRVQFRDPSQLDY